MEEKLKSVLFLSPYYDPEPFPFNSFIDTLKKKTSNLTVITSLPNYRKYGFYKKYSIFGPYNQKIDNLNIIRLPVIPRFNNTFLGIFFFYISFFISSFIFLLFYSIYKRNLFDHIITFCGSPVYVGFLGIISSKLLNCKNSIWIQDIWPEAIQSTFGIKSKNLSKFINYFQDFMWKKSDILFCQSESLKIYMSNRFVNKKIFTLLNPSREASVTKKNTTKKKKLNSKKTFSYMGNIGKAQSLDKFLDSFTKLDNQNFVLNICGDGSSLNFFKNKYNNKNIIWHGWIENKKLDKVIEETDFFILSLNSYGRQSLIVPSKLQTYYKFNKPILCFSTGASSDLITKTNTGFLCDNSNQDKVIENINLAMNIDPEKYKEMKDNCYIYYAKMLSPEKITDDFVNNI